MRQAITNLADQRTNGTHPGLILQRWLIRQSDPGERRSLLDFACRASRSESLRSVYAKAFERRARCFTQDKPSLSERFTVTGRLIVGLGSENVLETGLKIHQTYGVPIIPGSALKGLASHYCHEIWGQMRNEIAPEENARFRHAEEYHSLIFGRSKDGEGGFDDRGTIAFDDAWLTSDSLENGALRLDVMTPHHPNWRANEAPPTDFDSPVPVPFLSVAGTFEVRLSWCGPMAIASGKADAWLALTMKLLHEALAERGVGGKTSSGYGRLVPEGSVPDARRSPMAGSATTQPAQPQRQVTPPKANEKVEAVLLEERTRKGGWRARHQPSGLSGDIQNSAAVPSDKKAGDVLELFVAFANQRQIAFAYPTPEEEARRAASSRRGAPVRPGRRR